MTPPSAPRGFLRWPALRGDQGAIALRTISACIAKQASARAICFSTTILVISERDAAEGFSMPSQISGMRRAMISAEEMPISMCECFMGP